MTAPAETDVLIIGGGPTGLILSALLSLQGVRNVVVERRADMGSDPRAHLIRHRTMEILGQLGVADDVLAARPELTMDFINWCTTLAGPEIGRLDLRQPGESDTAARAPWINLSQSDLQPILLARARQEAVATIVQGTECVALVQEAGHVVARLNTPAGERSISAQYVVAADGAGSTTREALGIAMDGVGARGKFYMVHFKADLRPWIMHRQGPVFWIFNPQAVGTIIVHDPVASHVFMTPVFGAENEEAELPRRLAAALGTDIPLEILSIKIWVAHKQIAMQYRKGRVFLVGDAAHRFPPTGGLGLNTGAADAHNLAWKLALVVQRKSHPALLASYERECRPAAQANADDSLANMQRLALIGEALGNTSDLAALEDSLRQMNDSRRAALDSAIEAQRRHFLWDGALPRSAFAASDYLERRAVRYGAFTLRAPKHFPLRVWAWKLAVEFGLDVDFDFCDDPSPQFENTNAPPSGRAMLIRPDGLVEYLAEDAAMPQYEDIKAAMATVLSGGIADTSSAPRVGQLGYIGLEVPQLAPWAKFFSDVVGLMPAASEPDGAIGFRVDEYEHRFIVEEGPANDVAYIGWEVRDAEALARLRTHIEAAGVPVSLGDAALAKRRKVEDLIYFDDPDGVRTEVFWGPRIAIAPFHSAHVPEGFVTGACGLGHVVFGVKDRQKTYDFYSQVLGFRLSDYIKAEPFPDFEVHVTFMHANARHHSYAFVEIPFPTKLQHFMLEAKTLSAVGRAYDRFRDHGVPIALGLGHHPNDDAFSFYAKAPNGIEVEFGWGPLLIDDAVWQPRTYNQLSDWGHKPELPPQSA